MNNTKKASRTTHQQYEIMVTYMEKHPKLRFGTLDSTYTVRDRRNEWQDLVKLLNASGGGSTKTESQWRKVWHDYKCYVKTKVSRKQSEDAASLTPLEKRMVDLIGRSWIEGRNNVQKITTTKRSFVESEEAEESEADNYSTMSTSDLAIPSTSKGPDNLREKTKRLEDTNEAIDMLHQEQKSIATALEKIGKNFEKFNEEMKRKNKILSRRNFLEKERNLQFELMNKFLLAIWDVLRNHET